MKKVCLFLAVVLCVMLPASAFADVSAYSLTISDLTLSVGGIPMLNMKNVDWETDIATLDDGSFALRSAIDSISGTALKALTNISGDGVQMYLEGMSDAYGVDLGEVTGEKDFDLSDMMSSKEFLFLMRYAEICSQINMEDYIVSTTTEEYDGVPFERNDFVIESEEMYKVISEVMTALDDSGMIAEYLRQELGMDEDASFAEAYAQSNVEMAVDGAYWEGEDNITLDMFFYVSTDGGENFAEICEFYFDDLCTMDEDGEDTQDITVMFSNAAVEFDAIVAVADDVCNVDLYAMDISDAENPAQMWSFNARAGEIAEDTEGLYIVYSDGSSNPIFDMSVNFNEDAGTLNAFAYTYEDDCATGFALTAEGLSEDSKQINATVDILDCGESAGTFIISYTAEDECSGNLTITVPDESGAEQFSVSIRVSCAEKVMQESDFAISANSTIDIMEISEQQEEIAGEEITNALTNGIVVLTQDIPALALFGLTE